jgi:hypothetical protein
MSGPALRYLNARQGLNVAMAEYIAAAWIIDKDSMAIASDILDSVHEADTQVGKLIVLEEVM